MKKEVFSPIWLVAIGYVLLDGASAASLSFAAAFLAGWLLIDSPAGARLRTKLHHPRK